MLISILHQTSSKRISQNMMPHFTKNGILLSFMSHGTRSSQLRLAWLTYFRFHSKCQLPQGVFINKNCLSPILLSPGLLCFTTLITISNVIHSFTVIC